MAYAKGHASHKHHLKKVEHHLKKAEEHRKKAEGHHAHMVEVKEKHHVAKKRGRPRKEG